MNKTATIVSGSLLFYLEYFMNPIFELLLYNIEEFIHAVNHGNLILSSSINALPHRYRSSPVTPQRFI